MMRLLLITSRNRLVDELQPVLPAYADILPLGTPAEAEKHLQANNFPEADPVLLLCDAGSGPAVVDECHRLRRSAGAAEVPLLALIDRPEARPAVLEAGADDYLLTPPHPAEIRARLEPFLQTYIRKGGGLFSVIREAYPFESASPALDQYLGWLAGAFGAGAAWLTVFHTPEKIRIAGVYNAPPPVYLANGASLDYFPCLSGLLSGSPPPLIECDCLSALPELERGAFQFYLTVPIKAVAPPNLPENLPLRGGLMLAYPDPPRLSALARQRLSLIGEMLGALFLVLSFQHQSQTYAVQNAFLALLARLVNESRDMDTLLAQILEQSLPLLNASAGVIWLLTPDGQRLERAAHLTTIGWQADRLPSVRPAGAGLAGQVLQENRVRQVVIPGETTLFNPELDGLEAPSGYTLLAAPLHYHHTAVGVLYLYTPSSAPFQAPDIALLESIAHLTASAVVQARLREQTLHYAQQHQTLYEMSQQLTANLDVPVTLRRVLQWSARLTGAEWGLLWLGQIGSSDHPFRLAASMGLDLPPDRDIYLCPAEDIGAEAAKTRQVHIFNRLEGDVHHDPHLRPLLTPAPRNLLAAPLIYQEQTIGLLELFDKSGGAFTPEDRTILTLALKMVSLAVGNAYLYTQTVQLLREREQLHSYLAQSERLATIGRLTAVLSHEINNPMQAIQGALLLAQEEIHHPEEVQTYLNVGLEEAQRVIDLLERLRLIYRPEIGRPTRLDVSQILQTTLQLARKELKRKKITLTADLPPNLPPTIAVPGQLQLVFLSLLLNLEAAADPNRGRLHVHGQTVEQEIIITLTAEPVAEAGSPAVFTVEPASPVLETNLSLGLAFSRDIIISHGGQLEIEQTSNRVTCTVRLPVVR